MRRDLRILWGYLPNSGFPGKGGGTEDVGSHLLLTAELLKWRAAGSKGPELSWCWVAQSSFLTLTYFLSRSETPCLENGASTVKGPFTILPFFALRHPGGHM